MLMYGNSENVIATGNVYNLTSMKEGYTRLNNLIPPNSLGKLTGRDFDLAYADYILGNDMVFIEFFHIIYSLYIGTDVYIVVSENDWSENLLESLLKLIQQRYGYNACKIDSLEDYVYFSISAQIPEFNIYFGIKNLDMDKERYTYIMENIRIKNGGAPIIYE